jgi:hypothetical protein
MAQDLPPVPVKAPMTDMAGMPTQVWADWFRNLSGNSSKAASGYQRLAGGVVIQWGVTASLNSATTTAISFPTAFPTNCLIALACPKNNSAAATTATGQWGVGNYSASAFDLYNRTSIALVFNWIAVGY